jgi:ribose-phosphate pyrophosphokinase
MISLANSLEPRFFALSESHALGAATCREAGLECAQLEERAFDGGEFKLRPLSSVRNRTTCVFQSLAGSPTTSVADELVRLLFLLNGLRDAGASPLIALIPYLAYARKDRRTQSRDPVNSRYVAQLLEASGADRVICLDVHNPAAFDNSFRIPVDHLSALPMMADHFASRLPDADFVVVSPDVGGIKRAQLFQEFLEARCGRPVDLAFIEKRRAAGKVSTGRVVGEVSGRQALVIDDLCATGGTLIRAADRCRDAGATEVHVAVSHVPLAAGVEAVLKSPSITDMVVTDSVGTPAQPVTGRKPITLSIAPLFGQALRRMLGGQPVAPLLTRWPPGEMS